MNFKCKKCKGTNLELAIHLPILVSWIQSPWGRVIRRISEGENAVCLMKCHGCDNLDPKGFEPR